VKTNLKTRGAADTAGCCEARDRLLARRAPKDFPPLKPRKFSFDKEDLLAAEVTLPLDPACDVSRVRSVKMRRPYALHAELMLVDVSRLPAR